MSIDVGTRLQVRQRANFACEYCSVSEIDTGSELTVDHFQPQSKGGLDNLENLIYCCIRCNQYKSDYWPTQPDEPNLWNPRKSSMSEHWLLLADGVLHPITKTGEFTLKRLRLNRTPLIAYRLRQRQRSEELRLLERYQEVVNLLERLQHQQGALLKEQRILLEEQGALLKLLIDQQE
jgi:hypothetical protein